MSETEHWWKCPHCGRTSSTPKIIVGISCIGPDPKHRHKPTPMKRTKVEQLSILAW